MKYKIKILFILMLIFTIFFSISVVVYADTSPKPAINIVLENPPKNIYYVGILVDNKYFDDKDEIKRRYNEEFASDPEMAELLSDYYNEYGWVSRHLFVAGADGFEKPNPENKYNFFRFYANDFKVVIVTDDYQMIVSDEMHKKAFYSTIYYDVSSGEYREDNSLDKEEKIKGILFSFVITFIITIITESVLFIPLGSSKRNWIIFLLTNLSTQVMLYVLLMIFGSNFCLYAEGLVLVVESVIYYCMLEPKFRIGSIVYAIIANVVSFLIYLPFSVTNYYSWSYYFDQLHF